MKKLFLLLVLLNCLAACQQISTDCTIYDLKCEYLANPLGLDTQSPRFTWKIADERHGAKQSAYRIIVSDNKESTKSGKGTIWDSGKVKGGEVLTFFKGNNLQPFTKYFWAVQVWDKDGKRSPLSAIATFEMGMMKPENWRAAWISDTRNIDYKPAHYFRKEFTTPKKIKAARAYVAVAGLYELSINGSKVGNHQLDPAFTRYDRQVKYITHDITDYLQAGSNAIGILLGNGWYNHQPKTVWYFDEAPWRARPRFCMDIRLTYEDGSIDYISTDRTWRNQPSEVRYNGIYTGDHIDNNFKIKGWDEVGFDESGWKKSIPVAAPTSNITAQVLHPIRHVDTLVPSSLKKINNTKYIVDLGKNIAGVSQITVQGKQGTTIKLRHAERLDDKGNIDMSNIDVFHRPLDDSDPLQTDIYTLSGDGEEVLLPKFSYKGFRYIEIESSRPIALTKKNIMGIVMNSDVPPVGKIHSSDTLINKIWRAANSSYLANLYGYPTDCPQREKNGWTGDAHIAIETALFNYDGITIYEKWLADHRDEQQPNGVLPAIIPTSGWGYHWANGPDWTSTIAIIPWNLYLYYGDTRPLEENYKNIKRYVNYLASISDDYIMNWGLGDWVPVTSKTPMPYTSTIYFYVDATILSKTAYLLGNTEDGDTYGQLADSIKAAFNTKYLNAETGVYNNGYQTELSTALYWGLVPEDLTEKVAKNLLDSVVANEGFVDVGLLGSKAILNALSDHGYADIAYQVASKTDYPSWGWWIKNGFTTLSERWDFSQGNTSYNHIMFGEISAWYFKTLGGINIVESSPGFKKIRLSPKFVKGLDEFEAVYQSQQGEIASSWKKEGDKVIYSVIIPPNTSAMLHLEGKKIMQGGKVMRQSDERENFELFINAGTYTFVIE